MSVYDFSVRDLDKQEVSLEKYRGKVLLIVNTATHCGFTPQYVGLQTLYDDLHERGFEILDFPCNQFNNQAPGTGEEIHDFCISRYAITFPQFQPVNVNGKDADPLFTYLKKQKSSLLGGSIKWNFTKFLVDREGKVVDRFSPQETPEKIRSAIEALL